MQHATFERILSCLSPDLAAQAIRTKGTFCLVSCHTALAGELPAGLARLLFFEHYSRQFYYESLKNLIPDDADFDMAVSNIKNVKDSNNRLSKIGACNAASSLHNINLQTRPALRKATLPCPPKS